VGAVKTAPASHSLLGWLPAVMPANAGRVRVTNAEIVACLKGTRAELVESGPHVEIVGPSAVSGEAQYAIVPLTVSAASGRSRVLSLVWRGASSIAVGLCAAWVRWKLRGRNYSSVEVLRWDLGHTLRLPGEWTRRRLRVVERLPLGAVVVARRGCPPETILDRALAGAQEALDEPFRPSWPLVRGGGLVVLGNGAVLRVALGPACHQLERQRRALRMLEEAKPGPAIAARVPWPVEHGEAGLGRWALERRLPGSPSSPVLDERLLGECVEFLVALHAAGKATPERAALLDHADVAAAHADEGHARAIRSLAQSCDAVLADVPRGFAHGDFWTENLLTDSGRLVAVVDWAAAGPGRLPLLDLVHLRVSARRWSKREDIGTAVLAEMDTWARSGGDRWTQAYCRELDFVVDRARLEAFLVAYWLERVALELTTYSDRATPAWLDTNVRRVAHTLVEADLSLRP